jgi:hypothetical protein
MADRVVVCAGTRKGLFLLESDRRRERWKVRGPMLKGWEVYHAVVDTRSTPRLHAAVVSHSFASTVFSGEVSGKGLKGATRPPVPPKLLPAQEKRLKEWKIATDPRVWHVEPGHASQKDVLFAGTAPAALFRSEDRGKTWEEVKGLTRHPSRKHWTPGAGGMCLHSVQVDPRDPRRMYVAISSAGAFRTEDGGARWEVANEGLARIPGAPQEAAAGS